jgi:hypothetical protein
MTKHVLVLASLAASVLLTTPASAQVLLPEAGGEGRTSFGAKLELYSSIKEKFKGADGTVDSEFDMRLAPIRGDLAFGSETWRFDAGILYSRLFRIQDASWKPLASNYIGSTLEVEGAIGRYIVPGVAVRAGVNHKFLERDIVLYSLNQPLHLETTHTSPFVGVIVDLPDVGNLILRGNADIMFMTRTVDNYLSDSAITNFGFTGFKAGAEAGWMFTENFGAFGLVRMFNQTAKQTNDGDDLSRQIIGMGVGFGLQMAF